MLGDISLPRFGYKTPLQVTKTPKDNHLRLEAQALDDTSKAKHIVAIVNELSKEISRILVAHPLNTKGAAKGKNIANVVFLWGNPTLLELLK